MGARVVFTIKQTDDLIYIAIGVSMNVFRIWHMH
jgi:hypothetical protein